MNPTRVAAAGVLTAALCLLSACTSTGVETPGLGDGINVKDQAKGAAFCSVSVPALDALSGTYRKAIVTAAKGIRDSSNDPSIDKSANLVITNPADSAARRALIKIVKQACDAVVGKP